MHLASGLRLSRASAIGALLAISLGAGAAPAGEDNGGAMTLQATLPHEPAGSSLPPIRAAQGAPPAIAQSVSLPATPQRGAPAGMGGDRRVLMLMLLGRVTAGPFGQFGQ